VGVKGNYIKISLMFGEILTVVISKSRNGLMERLTVESTVSTISAITTVSTCMMYERRNLDLGNKMTT